MQKSHELGGPARLPGSAGALSTPWTQISPENRRRAGNTYRHLLLVLFNRCPTTLRHMRRSKAAQGNARVGERIFCSAAGEQPSDTTSALAHRSRGTSHPLQDTHNDTLWSKSLTKVEERMATIAGGYPILLDVRRSVL